MLNLTILVTTGMRLGRISLTVLAEAQIASAIRFVTVFALFKLSGEAPCTRAELTSVQPLPPRVRLQQRCLAMHSSAGAGLPYFSHALNPPNLSTPISVATLPATTGSLYGGGTRPEAPPPSPPPSSVLLSVSLLCAHVEPPGQPYARVQCGYRHASSG